MNLNQGKSTFQGRKSRSAGMLLFLVLFIFYSSNAFAHKVNLFAFAEGDTVFVEGYFVDGKKAKNSEVTVTDKSGKEVQRGTTDAEGQFTFKNPGVGELHIAVDAGMGHRAEFQLAEDELSDTNLDAESDSSSAQDNSTAQSVGTSALDQDLLRAEVERAVSKAIKPLVRNIAEMREEKSLAEIIGGIGFIFGAMGVFMFIKARKELEKNG